jgi:hypothetical protein
MIWNVRFNPAGPDLVERTTLAAESKARRWETGRGYCVDAATAADARAIVRDWGYSIRGDKLAVERLVMARERQRVPVLGRA